MVGKATLFSFWRSQASYRVRIALFLKDVSAELRTVDLLKGEQHREDYRAINPEGLVPAFVEGSEPPLVQSLAILEYIDEKHPDPPLCRAACVSAPTCAPWRRSRRWTRIR